MAKLFTSKFSHCMWHSRLPASSLWVVWLFTSKVFAFSRSWLTASSLCVALLFNRTKRDYLFFVSIWLQHANTLHQFGDRNLSQYSWLRSRAWRYDFETLEHSSSFLSKPEQNNCFVSNVYLTSSGADCVETRLSCNCLWCQLNYFCSLLTGSTS